MKVQLIQRIGEIVMRTKRIYVQEAEEIVEN